MSDEEGAEYSDYSMVDPSGTPRAGVCHRRGPNASLPPEWIVYFVVDELTRAADECIARGGKVVHDRRENGGFVVIRDPAGAVCALYHGQA